MLQITEDTPPDMLAGAMDLAVHLPTGRAVKMSVERSTPMMDLLVQITTNHQLQLSNYTLQALGMAPSSEHSDKILPYKPNTPIGTLDTQHIKVIPKSRTLPVPKNPAPGHQPFESTFRLKVHLPRNQLYVTRVSRSVLLEDIMKKVCEEKKLDPMKYELKHPANLDEALDPKLTLSDYQITEIYVVSKGTVSLNQAFSTSDIMALRKEEERKQMHNKTGGGVLNLIFRRGKSSMGSGSISSDARSISPTQSDDSRSVTPPGVQQQILTPPKKDPPPDRPKPPQRKRRPAPKPPQQPDNSRGNAEESRGNAEESRRNSEESRRTSEDRRRISEEKPASTVSEVSELQSRRLDNGLVICHSRNSSDSSGYHEASVLSEHCNTSLPRRPKSAFVGSGDMEKMSKLHSHSTTNLSKMSSHSKSTTSLGITGRKKKAAPPPPPALRASNPAINLETPSPVVASPSAITQEATLRTSQEPPSTPSNPLPLPRSKSRAPPTPHPRTNVVSNIIEDIEECSDVVVNRISSKVDFTKVDNGSIIEDVLKEVISFEGRQNDEITEFFKKTQNDVPPVEDGGSKELEERHVYQNKEKGIETETVRNIPLCTNETDIKDVEDQKSSVSSSSNEKLPKQHEDSSIETCEGVNDSEDLNEYSQNSPSEIETLISQKSSSSSDKNLPEIVAVIPKTPKEKRILSSPKFDSMGKKQLQTLSSFLGTEKDTKTLDNKQSDSSSSTRTSVTSALGNFNFIDDFSDMDESVFTGSVSSIKNFSISNEVYNQLFGMHNFEDIEMDKNQSINSLRSLRSLYGFSIGNGMKKWKNTEDLDTSLTSLGPDGRWVAGDYYDSESLTSHPALDSLPSITTSNILEDVSENEIKPFGSTDSGIAQENLEKDPEDFRPITPPPPPAFLDEPLIFSSNIIEEQQKKQISLPAFPQTVEEIKVETIDATVLKKSSLPESNTPLKTKDSKKVERLIEAVTTNEDNDKDKEVAEIDWQYQLPSPPKAFRDSSPVNLPDGTTSESHSVTNFKDSVVTSPELFEKLKSIEDSQSEKGTITSDLTSVISEEDRTPLMNTLSLENLERRKSLVYNRELATSLKMSDVEAKRGDAETFSSSLTKFEDTFTEMQNSSQQKQVGEPKYVQKTATASHTHTLPNFKISTYDQPKHKIKVFEDDTIRSNTEVIHRMKRTNAETSTLNRSYVGHSMENISIRKNSIDEHSSYSNEDKEYTFFRPENPPARSFGPVSSVFRSESFSKDNWAPSKPVLRSKSHLTLDAFKYRTDRRDSADEEISRSNSFYDVSGLQSLGVMRMIQNKLNTPTSSMENLHVQDKHQKPFVKPELPKELPQKSPPMETSKEHQEEIQKPPETTQTPPETIQKSTETVRNLTETIVKPPEKIYKYTGPPSINMGTWSERPKVPVSVKEDADYTLGNVGNVSSKLIVNTTNNNITSNNSIEIKSSTPPSESNGLDNSVNIKVNGTEPIKQGNVVIKIGNVNSQAPKTINNHRFISHTTATGYRKPFTTLYKNQRPHSVAFDSDFDISRVPVVRSVELKKPFKDLGNTSVTQLNKEEPVSGLRNTFSNIYRSNETLSSKTYLNQTNGVEEMKDTKPAPKISSYKPMNAPVVRGFKTSNETNWANRLSWNPPGNFNTLPSKPRERDSFATNSQVSFSQSNLRRTESSKMFVNESNSPNMRTENNFSPGINMPPPPPPQMPKVLLKKTVVKPVEPVVDQRDQLLSAIRNFGGKKGLKAAKA